jgi:hypothetical protein
MTRHCDAHPTKTQLGEMTSAQLNAYIENLRQELTWRHSGPVHKVRAKQLEVAIKVRELRLASEFAGDV